MTYRESIIHRPYGYGTGYMYPNQSVYNYGNPGFNKFYGSPAGYGPYNYGGPGMGYGGLGFGGPGFGYGGYGFGISPLTAGLFGLGAGLLGGAILDHDHHNHRGYYY